MPRPTKAKRRNCGRRTSRATKTRRRSTQAQDDRVLALLERGKTRKEAAERLRLTYYQVSLAVYRSDLSCPVRL